MTKPLRIGIAGLGTVGVGVIKIIQEKKSLLEARTGKQIIISAVTAKNKDKERGVLKKSVGDWINGGTNIAKTLKKRMIQLPINAF